jgi:hypothetical protein
VLEERGDIEALDGLMDMFVDTSQQIQQQVTCDVAHVHLREVGMARPYARASPRELKSART